MDAEAKRRGRKRTYLEINPMKQKVDEKMKEVMLKKGFLFIIYYCVFLKK